MSVPGPALRLPVGRNCVLNTHPDASQAASAALAALGHALAFHSIEPSETNSNFGFNLPWWDRLLGTYRAQPAAGHDDMTIGVGILQDRHPQGLLWMLLLPVRGKPGSYSINRRPWS